MLLKKHKLQQRICSAKLFVIPEAEEKMYNSIAEIDQYLEKLYDILYGKLPNYPAQSEYNYNMTPLQNLPENNMAISNLTESEHQWTKWILPNLPENNPTSVDKPSQKSLPQLDLTENNSTVELETAADQTPEKTAKEPVKMSYQQAALTKPSN